jgi:hypothetical protein
MLRSLVLLVTFLHGCYFWAACEPGCPKLGPGAYAPPLASDYLPSRKVAGEGVRSAEKKKISTRFPSLLVHLWEKTNQLTFQIL